MTVNWISHARSVHPAPCILHSLGHYRTSGSTLSADELGKGLNYQRWQPGSRHQGAAHRGQRSRGTRQAAACSLARAALVIAETGNASSDVLYTLTQTMDGLVQQQLSGVSPLTFAVVFAAGLLTSLSPCTLSVLPLTLGYIGGYSSSGPGDASSSSSSTASTVSRAAAFAFGLAMMLALLGVTSSLLGRTYGQFGSGLPVAVSLVAILMGLNLLEVVQLRLPSLDVDVRRLSAPPLVQAYLAGLTFALAASPCSTPVLATLLAYVATSQDPLLGGSLLLAYTSGYVGPLLVAATFAGALKQVLAMRQWSGWVTPASGVLLLSGGTYTLLLRLT